MAESLYAAADGKTVRVQIRKGRDSAIYQMDIRGTSILYSILKMYYLILKI